MQANEWADLKRPRKLALLGWRPKHEIDDEKVAIQDHPMHDHVLDGERIGQRRNKKRCSAQAMEEASPPIGTAGSSQHFAA